MYTPKLAALLSAAVLTVSGGAAVFAQTGLPEEVPAEAEVPEIPEEVEEPEEPEEVEEPEELEEPEGPETTDGESEDAEDATAFSEWVRSLDLERCHRGLSVANAARNAPKDDASHDFSQYVIPEEDAPCLHDRGDSEPDTAGESGDADRDARADNTEARSGDAEDHRGQGGPPEGAPGGPPEHAGPSGARPGGGE